MDFKSWKDSVASLIKETAFSMRQLVPESVYGYLCASALLPVVTAFGPAGDFSAVFGVLSTVAGSLGTNLIANQLQSWRDKSGTEIYQELALDLAQKAASDMEWRRTLDELLEKLEVGQTLQTVLGNDDKEWFRETLRSELSQSREASEADCTITLLLGSGAVLAGTYIGVQNIQILPDPLKAASQKVLEHYLERLRPRCHVLPLGAMGGQDGVCAEVTLDKVYVSLDTRTMVPLTEAEKALRKDSPRGRMHPGGDDSRPLGALEAAEKYTRLVLLGDPGSGKSTFVSQLAASLAGARLGLPGASPGFEKDPVPVFTVLRDLAPRLAGLSFDGLSERQRENLMVAAVREQWKSDLASLNAEDFVAGLEEALSDGKAVLIFDGMDEVPESLRPRVRESILALLGAYPFIARMIVTCRIRSYTGSAVLGSFQSHTLAPFDEEKIGQFVSAWYQAQADLDRMDASKAGSKAEDLTRAALSTNLRELASNPMLLTTMALIHQSEVGLPRQRVRLYHLVVHILVGKWQKRKGITVSKRLEEVLADDLKLRNILERVAYEAHKQKQGEAADLFRGDLLTLLDESTYLGDTGLAAEFLDYVDMRAGILVGRGGPEQGRHPKSYSFPHRTFQEYLAGCFLLRGRTVERNYRGLLSEGDYWYLAGQLGAEELLFNRKVPESLLDLMYALCPSSEPKQETEWRAVVWSGQMATIMGKSEIEADAEKPDGGTTYLTRLLPRLAKVLRKSPLNAIERAEAGRILARLGDLRDDVLTADKIEFRWIPAGPFLMESRDDTAVGENKKTLLEKNIPYLYGISKYPVTNAQFMEFVEAGGYKKGRYWMEAEKAGYWKDGKIEVPWETSPREAPYDFGEPFNLSNHPVVGVNWYESLAYTIWLTERMRACGKIPMEWKVRLPGEAEWEKAARGGIQISDGSMEDLKVLNLCENPEPERIYPWGDSPDSDRGNFNETGIETTSAVGCFPRGASEYGVEELSGNVWEWTRDLWSEGSGAERTGGGGQDLSAALNVGLVLKGGTFYKNKDALRCGVRYWFSPNGWGNYVGFRVVSSCFTSGL